VSVLGTVVVTNAVEKNIFSPRTVNPDMKLTEVSLAHRGKAAIPE